MSASRKELVRTIYSLMQSERNSTALAEKIAAYLLAERSSKDVGPIMRDVESLRMQKDGVLEATVTSAHPLSDTAKQNIQALFDANQVIIHEEQDPSLLGGVKVRAYDKQADYSIRTRLQRLRQGA